MDKLPERVYLPLQRTENAVRFYTSHEAPETPPSVSGNAHPEGRRGSWRKRSREEQEENPTPSKRSRTSQGPAPVEETSHSSSVSKEEVWFPYLYRSEQRKRSREDPEDEPTPSKRSRTSQVPAPVEETTSDSSSESQDESSSSSESQDESSSYSDSQDESSGSLPARVRSSTRTSLTSYTRADFDALYEVQKKLGSGGFGRVYAATRREDLLSVAIKHIPMPMVLMDEVDGKQTDMPLEVRLMIQAAAGDSEGPSAAVVLLDWFQLGEELILVQERPEACMDLEHYLNSKGGRLEEQDAKMVVQQTIEGLLQLHSRGVCHRDIKPENLLVGTGSGALQVRIIDLGCSCDIQQEPYHTFSGTHVYIPPEFFFWRRYEAEPMTVWQVGLVLFEMLTGRLPFRNGVEIVNKRLPPVQGVSSGCSSFLRHCLNKQAQDRPTLESLLQHPWLR